MASFVKTPQESQQLAQMKFDFYDAEIVFAYWLTRSEVVERLLPPPLKPGDPVATAFIANYPSTSWGLPYREAGLYLSAQYEQAKYSYCLSMLVTNDMAMALGREKFGFPKKIAQIQLGQAGGKTQGYVERNGVRFFEVEFAIDEQFVAEEFKNTILQPILQPLAFHQETGDLLIKSFTASDDQIFDYPPRLIRQRTVFRPKTIEWGQAHIKLFPSNYDPWYEVEVVKPIGAMRIVGDNTALSGQVLTELDPMAYLPYSWTKWDW